MAERVLITGGCGFIGYHLAASYAEEGIEVVIADNFSRAVKDHALDELTEKPNVTLVTIDLLDRDSVMNLGDEFSYIYHLAAIIGLRHVVKNPFGVLSDNVALTANALELSRGQKNLKRFIFASTSEVIAGSLLHLDLPVPTPEDTPLALTDLAHPRTSYMLSKLYGEAMCHHAGLPFTIVRPHNVYGPRMGMAHVVPELLNQAWNLGEGKMLDVASVDHRRAFCYVDDAIPMLRILATSKSAENGTFNLGNQADEVSIGDLAGIILQTVGRNLDIKAKPATPGSPSRRCPDMTRTITATGYTPAVSLADGVARTFDWYSANVFNCEGVSAA